MPDEQNKRPWFSSWRIAARLARRELRGGLTGFRVFLACLALGVGAIAAVQSVAQGIEAGLREDGRVILGGDLYVRSIYRPITDAQVAWLAARGRLERSFELRAVLRTTDETRSTLAELAAVDSVYPLYGAFELEQGGDLQDALAVRDGVPGMVIERVLADRLGVGMGDRLRLGETAVRVTGLIAREPDRGSRGFVIAPRAVIAASALPDTGLVQPGSLITYLYRLALPSQASVEAVREDLAQAFPNPDFRVRDHRNAAPQLEEVIGRLTLFLTLVGLTSLLVGGVGVGNAVRAYLAGKTRTIATLKCIGAEGATVFRTYLLLVLVLAVGGIALGLAIGALAPPLVSWGLAGLIPVPTRIGLYPDALALSALFGLFATLAFALMPLGRAQTVPAVALFREGLAPEAERGASRWRVRLTPAVFGSLAAAAALACLAILTAEVKTFAAWFVVGAIAVLLAFRGAGWLVERGAARVTGLRHPGLRLAVANLHRPGNPTGSVVLSLGVGLTVLVAVSLIEANLSRQVQESIPDRAPAFFFVDIQPHQREAFRAAVSSVPGTANLQEVPSLRGRISAVNGRDPEDALVDRSESWIIRGDRGLTYSASLPPGSELLAGQWWADDRTGGPPLVSIIEDVAKAFAIGPGDRLTVNVLGRDITAEVANVRAVRWQTLSINFSIVFSPGVLDRVPQTVLATIEAEPEAEAAVSRAIASRFPNVTMVRVRDALETVNGLLGNIGAAVRAIAAITLVAGTLVLAGAIAAGHARRVWDAVVLKVLGATRRDVLTAFALEYGLLGLITAVIAAVLGTITAWAVTVHVMAQDWSFAPLPVLSTIVIATAVTLALGFAGTWRAMGQPAAPLLRNP